MDCCFASAVQGGQRCEAQKHAPLRHAGLDEVSAQLSAALAAARGGGCSRGSSSGGGGGGCGDGSLEARAATIHPLSGAVSRRPASRHLTALPSLAQGGDTNGGASRDLSSSARQPPSPLSPLRVGALTQVVYMRSACPLARPPTAAELELCALQVDGVPLDSARFLAAEPLLRSTTRTGPGPLSPRLARCDGRGLTWAPLPWYVAAAGRAAGPRGCRSGRAAGEPRKIWSGYQLGLGDRWRGRGAGRGWRPDRMGAAAEADTGPIAPSPAALHPSCVNVGWGLQLRQRVCVPPYE
eukprot:SAG11_NODE_961_length_6379_cov_141.081529_4_plen_296_part_00